MIMFGGSPIIVAEEIKVARVSPLCGHGCGVGVTRGSSKEISAECSRVLTGAADVAVHGQREQQRLGVDVHRVAQ